MIAAFLGLILLLSAGCAPEKAAMSGTMQLSLDQPSRDLAVPAEVAADPPRAVVIAVTRNDNPAGRAFLIVAELLPPGRPPVRVGTISPHPADQPGRYVLSWKRAAARVGPDARLRLSLRPLRPTETGTIAADLTVTWSQETR